LNPIFSHLYGTIMVRAMLGVFLLCVVAFTHAGSCCHALKQDSSADAVSRSFPSPLAPHLLGGFALPEPYPAQHHCAATGHGNCCCSGAVASETCLCGCGKGRSGSVPVPMPERAPAKKQLAAAVALAPAAIGASSGAGRAQLRSLETSTGCPLFLLHLSIRT